MQNKQGKIYNSAVALANEKENNQDTKIDNRAEDVSDERKKGIPNIDSFIDNCIESKKKIQTENEKENDLINKNNLLNSMQGRYDGKCWYTRQANEIIKKLVSLYQRKGENERLKRVIEKDDFNKDRRELSDKLYQSQKEIINSLIEELTLLIQIQMDTSIEDEINILTDYRGIKFI